MNIKNAKADSISFDMPTKYCSSVSPQMWHLDKHSPADGETHLSSLRVELLTLI